MPLKEVHHQDLWLDDSLQLREKISGETVEEYAELIRCGVKLPPPVVFQLGDLLMVADGFHRLLAFRRVVSERPNHPVRIEVDVRRGARREAILHAARENGHRGLRWTAADKRRVVSTLLADAEWSRWTDTKIAQECGVSHTLVGRVRKGLQAQTSRGTTRASSEIIKEKNHKWSESTCGRKAQQNQKTRDEYRRFVRADGKKTFRKVSSPDSTSPNGEKVKGRAPTKNNRRVKGLTSCVAQATSNGVDFARAVRDAIDVWLDQQKT